MNEHDETIWILSFLVSLHRSGSTEVAGRMADSAVNEYERRNFVVVKDDIDDPTFNS
jgi:hypothetical protein